MEKHIYLELDDHKIAISVSVNGVELIVNRFHQVPSKKLSINQWVWSGRNECSVNISINPKWTEPLKEQAFVMEIVEYSGSKPNYERKVLQKIEWNYVEDETKFPVNLTVPFELDVPYGNWLWKNGDPLNSENVNIDSLKSFIQNLHGILNDKNYFVLEPILQVKAKELAMAYYIPVEQRLEDQKFFFMEELFAESNWGMQPLDFENMLIVFQACGKLIEVLDKKGKPFLKANPSEETTFSLPLRLCYFENNWVLCR